MNNDATLITLGYGRFFSMDEQCNKWNFNVPWADKNETQNVILDMRKEINELVNVLLLRNVPLY